jgi:hypothetical protein
MKTIVSFLSILLFTVQISAQDKFELKPADAQKLKQQFEDNNYQENIILSYLKENYKVTSKKLDIKLDPDFDNKECGFTLKFEHGIVYTYHNCGEAKPVEEKILFPKVDKVTLQKWIETIEKANPAAADTNNVWYENETEFGPKDEGVGCYYKILPSKDKSIVEVWCGC